MKRFCLSCDKVTSHNRAGVCTICKFVSLQLERQELNKSKENVNSYLLLIIMLLLFSVVILTIIAFFSD